MSAIRVVWGSATGPTAVAAYDAALAAANVHNYNLVTVSSVIPAGATVEAVGTAPDLGPAGEELTVVESHAGARPGGEGAVAGIGWSRSRSGRGIFYEATGTDPGAVTERIRRGLAHGRELRDWEFVDGDVVVRRGEPTGRAHAATVVCAVYGESRPIL